VIRLVIEFREMDRDDRDCIESKSEMIESLRRLLASASGDDTTRAALEESIGALKEELVDCVSAVIASHEHAIENIKIERVQ